MLFSQNDEESRRNDFRARKAAFKALTREVESALVDAIRAAELNVYYIESRTKEEDSYVEKCNRKMYIDPLRQSTDISGCRVITNYRGDIDHVERIIREAFIVDDDKSARYDQPTDPRTFGYSSRHFVVSLKEPLEQSLIGLKAEIQVRTALQHVWAAIEHNLQYKKDLDKPLVFQRRFSRISAMLELIDDEFSNLRAEATQAVLSVTESSEIQDADAAPISEPTPSGRANLLQSYLKTVGLQDALLIKQIVSEVGSIRFASRDGLGDFIQTQRQFIESSQKSLIAEQELLAALREEVETVNAKANADIEKMRISSDVKKSHAKIHSISQEIGTAGAKISAVHRLLKYLECR